MSVRQTTAMVNKRAQGYGLRDILRDGQLYIYTGTQPASADSAPTGTNLVIFTLSGGVFTAPVRATATLTLSGSGAGGGSVDTVKLGGAAYNLLSAPVTWASYPSLALLTDAVAANINARENPWNVVAVSDGVSVVTLYAPHWMGALAAGLTVASTETAGTSLAVADTNFVGGTTAVNGLNFDFPAVAGVLSKPVGVEWKGTALAGGTAGWARFVAGGSSVNGAGATEVRLDCAIATSGSDINVGSLTIQANAPQIFGDFTITLPQG